MLFTPPFIYQKALTVDATMVLSQFFGGANREDFKILECKEPTISGRFGDIITQA